MSKDQKSISSNAWVANKATTVQAIVEAAIGQGTFAAAPAGSLYSFTYTVGETVWNVYTNVDYATDVVTFTYSK